MELNHHDNDVLYCIQYAFHVSLYEIFFTLNSNYTSFQTYVNMFTIIIILKTRFNIRKYSFNDNWKMEQWNQIMIQDIFQTCILCTVNKYHKSSNLM